MKKVEMATEHEENETTRGEKIVKRVEFNAERVLKELGKLSTKTK